MQSNLVGGENGKNSDITIIVWNSRCRYCFFHTEYGPWENANCGVKFFFTLSALVMMMSTENKEQNRKNVKDYWLPKLIKIYLLYLIML